MSSKAKFFTLLLVSLILGTAAFLAFSGEERKGGSLEKSVHSSPLQGESVWARRCIDKDQNSCEAFQSLTLKGNKMRLIEVAVSLPEGPKKNAKMAVLLPLGIFLGKGIALQVDGGKVLKVPVYSCTQTGCVSNLTPSPAFVQSMRAGKMLKVVFIDGAQKKVKIEMDLKGFSEALY